ncbi:N-acetylglucosamine-6-phosphate deacetylase [Lunatimonas salinarum]|uniref:N-acetylglucosamine-6-phosphate deacetylase n=1 Tax=Lunatimonas salinarum TaxID=1774590 RepID=UPI001ADFF99B|nr:N-acetylglucosamine-6-phosphate deacetylase [Lunatimonas salinarum]
MSKDFQIINGKVITPFEVLSEASLWIKDGKIAKIDRNNGLIPGIPELDAQGHYVSPGFIDIHVHGGGGCDFMDAEVEGFLQIAELHARYGTTAMVPTTLTSESSHLFRILEIYEKALAVNKRGASFLGLHLEGPYFSMNQRGAQDPRYIRDPDPREYEPILAKAHLINRWSAAPERDGALAFGRRLRECGILAAIAHTDAVYEEVLAAIESGYSLSTHLYSGMSGVTRRNAFRFAGVIESSLLLDELDVEIIGDGVHLPAPFLKLIYKIKGPDKIALITDAMRAAGTSSTESILGHKEDGLAVIVEDGVAKLPDRSSFAGSVATSDRLVRTMMREGDVPLIQVIRMMSTTPARICGVQQRKGSLTVGKDADIVVFNDDICVQHTIVEGRIVYSVGGL